MQVFAETVEQMEARWESFLAANAINESAMMDAMPPVDAATSGGQPLDIELPY